MAEDESNEPGSDNPNNATPSNEIQPAPADAPAQPSSADDKQARTWGMLCHLAAFAGLILPSFGHVVGPLVIWLIKKDEYPFVDAQGKKSLNFQISMTIYGVVAFLLCFVLIGLVLLPALALVDIICVIIASVKASNGEEFNYPMAIKFFH